MIVDGLVYNTPGMCKYIIHCSRFFKDQSFSNDLSLLFGDKNFIDDHVTIKGFFLFAFYSAEPAR